MSRTTQPCSFAFAAKGPKTSGVVGGFPVQRMKTRGRARLWAFPEGTGSVYVLTGCGVVRALIHCTSAKSVMPKNAGGGGCANPFVSASAARAMARLSGYHRSASLWASSGT